MSYSLKYILLTVFIIHSGVIFGQKKDCIKVLDSITNQEVYLKAEVEPEPIAGIYELQKSIRQNIKIGTDTEVYSTLKAHIGFIICEDGSIIGERIIYDTTNFGLGKNLLETATKFKWKSGKCSGQSVPVLYKFPIVICLK